MLASEFEARPSLLRAVDRRRSSSLVLQATADRSKEFADRAEALFEAGRGTKGDALAAQVNLGNDRITVEKQRAVVVPGADRPRVLARPARGRQELDAVDPALPDDPAAAVASTLEQALDLARTNRPLLVQCGAQVKAAEANVEPSQAAGWAAPAQLPGASTAARAPRPTRSSPTSDRQSAVTGGINLNWDLFSGFQTDALTKQAQAQVAQAKLNLAQTERDVEGQVKVRARLATVRSWRALEIAQQNREHGDAEPRLRAGALQGRRLVDPRGARRAAQADAGGSDADPDPHRRRGRARGAGQGDGHPRQRSDAMKWWKGVIAGVLLLGGGGNHRRRG